MNKKDNSNPERDVKDMEVESTSNFDVGHGVQHYRELRERWNEFLKQNPNFDENFEEELRKKYLRLMAETEFAKNYDTSKQAQFIFLLLSHEFPEVTKEQVEIALTILKSSKIHPIPRNRGSELTDGLDIKLAHNFDLTAFECRVDDLFRWHYETEISSKYLAPYFALVQSSGMGKTKLLTEYRKACNSKSSETGRTCLTILCLDGGLSTYEFEQYYNYELTFPVLGQSDDYWRSNVWCQLDDILENIREPNHEVVLLFDEAHGLMRGGNSTGPKNLAFRALRWWLRRDDQRRKHKVVAVLAGTTAKLAIFFPPDPPPMTVSQLSYRNYSAKGSQKEADLVLYDPFYQLNTISCLRKELRTEESFPTDLERAAIYGRPLFALYSLEESLFLGDKLYNCAARLVLSNSDYQDDLPACLSVLGSRVQMGDVGSFDTLSKLVSSGYACLVDFQVRKREYGGVQRSTPSPTAQLTFMPDPVIARLAMCFMDEDWSLKSLQGTSKQFWVKTAAQAFDTRLCHPEKDDVGEVFAALYMLMCADELRKQIDPSWKTFGVSLDSWFQLLKEGGRKTKAGYTTDSKKAKIEDPQQGSTGVDGKRKEDPMTRGAEDRVKPKESALMVNADSTSMVSFIQFCRNEMRSNSFDEKVKLEYLYRSGLGWYTYENCKGIDMAAPIRSTVTSKTGVEECYHPLLVSVKNWATVCSSDVVAWEASMKNFLKTMRSPEPGKGGTLHEQTKNDKTKNPTAVCIILLVGCSVPPIVSEKGLGSSDLLPFPEEDVFRFVSIPENDAFGISQELKGLARASVQCEMYSSHGFIPGEATANDFLPSTAPATDVAEVNEWFEAIKLPAAELPL